mmetsp:Transcript_30031/g.63684  ORF Transcript_30031/g.63684 Transcript_30031/m.63684 type:complete len:220 (-) Transcript_30031:181-840(-)
MRKSQRRCAEKTWKQRDEEGNDEEEGETDANKKQATSAIQKTPPRFKKGNSNLDCLASVASKKVGDISAASGVAKATTATGGSVLEQLLALPEHEQASLLARLAALGPAKTGGVRLAANSSTANSSTALDGGEDTVWETEIEDAASTSRKSPPETLGTSSGGINKGAGGDRCGINEGEGSAAKGGGVTLAANSSTASDGGEVAIAEREVDAAADDELTR